MSQLSRFKKKYTHEALTPKLRLTPFQGAYSGEVSLKIPLEEGSAAQLTGVINKSEILNSIGLIKANPKLNPRSKKMSREMTKSESHIWFNLLTRRQLLGYKFTKQKIVFNYILDFYCSELLLAIEIDGESHANQLDYDKARDSFMNSIGIRTIRVTNDEVLNNLVGVKLLLEKDIQKRQTNLSDI